MTLAAILMLIILAGLFYRSRFLSFRSQSPSDYVGTGPEFSLMKQLNGELLSEGVIYGPGGKVANSFVARMVGEWDGKNGTLSEYFTYSNGKQITRKWYLKMGTGDTFAATADDIVGVGKGTISGATVKLEYRITLPEDAGGHTLDVTDWMYLTDSGVIMNRSEMRKFGIKVAELVATIRPSAESKPHFAGATNGYDTTAVPRPLQ